MNRLIPLVFAATTLAGCFGSAPPPPPRDHYYRLLVPRPAATGTVTPFAGVLSVKPLDADALLRERPVLFSAGGAHEVQQHDYHYWTDPPPTMLQGQLAAYLRARGVARAVVTPDMRIRPDFEIGGRVKRLERLLGDGPARVVVELELALVRLADGRPVTIDTYSAQRTAEDSSVEASITAMSAALGGIFDRFVSRAVAAQVTSNPDSRD